MQEWTIALLDLQEIDMKIGKLEEELALVPRRMDEVMKACGAEKDAYGAALQNVRGLESSIRKIEAEIESLAAQKGSFQSKSAIIKNNDEYRAALLQIEMCEHSIADAEGRELQAMEELDGARKALDERKAALEKAEKQAREQVAVLEGARDRCEAELAGLKGERPGLASKVDEDVLKCYDRLRGSRLHRASKPCAVPVNDGTCRYCNICVPKQTFSDAIKGRKITCGSCGAILYYDDRGK